MLLAVAAPVFANISERVSWVDEIPGLRMVKFEESSFKVEKDYVMTAPQKEYEQVIRGLKENGWRIVEREGDEGENAEMPEVTAVKDGMKLKAEVDRDYYHGKEVSKLELSVKSYR